MDVVDKASTTDQPSKCDAPTIRKPDGQSRGPAGVAEHHPSSQQHSRADPLGIAIGSSDQKPSSPSVHDSPKSPYHQSTTQDSTETHGSKRLSQDQDHLDAQLKIVDDPQNKKEDTPSGPRAVEAPHLRARLSPAAPPKGELDVRHAATVRPTDKRTRNNSRSPKTPGPRFQERPGIASRHDHPQDQALARSNQFKRSGRVQPIRKGQSAQCHPSQSPVMTEAGGANKKAEVAETAQAKVNNNVAQESPIINDLSNPPRRRRDKTKTQRPRGIHDASRGARRSAWPDKSEIPKVDETRWDPDRIGTGEPFEVSDWESARADNGQTSQSWPRRTAEHDGQYALVDFSGNLAPAPIDWDRRPAFRDEQSRAHFEQWRVQVGEQLSHGALTFPLSEPQYGSVPAEYCFVANIAPSYWIPVEVEGQELAVFWTETVHKTEPMPCDAGDLDNVQPWWQKKAVDGFVLEDYIHPQIDGIDPDESSDERLAREHDFGSFQHSQNRINLERAKQAKRNEGDRRARARRQRILEKASADNDAAQIEDRRIVTVGHFTVRSARPSDAPQIQALWDFYIQHTHQAPETDCRSLNDVGQSIQLARDHRRPFLVACQAGETFKPRKRGRRKHDFEAYTLPEKVIGFGFATDYDGTQPGRGPFRYTVEIKLFVHYLHVRKGVASCLMDKLLGMLDVDYLERGDFAIRGDELHGPTPQRTILSILVQIPYSGDYDSWNWLWTSLTKSFRFKQAGNLHNIGFKLGQKFNLAIFERETSCRIENEDSSG